MTVTAPTLRLFRRRLATLLLGVAGTLGIATPLAAASGETAPSVDEKEKKTVSARKAPAKPSTRGARTTAKAPAKRPDATAPGKAGPAAAPARRTPKATAVPTSRVAEAQQGTARSKAAQRRRPSRRSARRTPARAAATPAALRATAPVGASALAGDLSFLSGSRIRSGHFGALVVSLTRGDTLFARNASTPLVPASTMKLVTAALALERFGPDYRFSTDVLRDGALAPNGTVQGNLVLRGDGDPGFSNRFGGGAPGRPMRELAAQVRASGVRRVTGDIVGDASAFEQRLIPEGWRTRYLDASYAARVSALSLNENTVWIVVRPGASGGAGVIGLEPSSSAIPLVNKVRTVAGSGARISVRRTTGGGLEVRGTVGTRGGTRRYEMVVEDPAVFTAGAFRDALAAEGILVEGRVRMGRTPPGAVKVASRLSPTLDQLVTEMNGESVNHIAELLFRNAARGPDRAGTGSADAGNVLMHRLLQDRAGVDPREMRAADGSGLSPLDEVSPRALVKLLAWGHQSPWSSVFHASLPVAGTSETLRHRMKFTPAQGNLHAKTGTTNEVISLAGYVTARNGELLAFSFIYNGNDRWNAKATIDAMGATMAGFAR